MAVEPLRLGTLPGNAAQVVCEYRISFTDFRDRYVEPRGGRLRVGWVNKGPKPAKPATGAAPAPAPAEGEGRELKLSEMTVQCLKRMGVADTSVPDGVDDTDPPRDVKWFGNHAPTELEKLLALCNCVFVPANDGTGHVVKIGDGDPPTYPKGELLPELEIPAVDRRGKTVIVSSFPTRAVETMAMQGPDKDTWGFVVQDSFGNWKKPEEADLLGGRTLIEHFNENFDNITPSKGTPQGQKTLIETLAKGVPGIDYTFAQERIRGQAYRCIRLNQTKHPTAPLSKVFGKDTDTPDAPPSMLAKVALQDPASKRWENSPAPIDVPIQFFTDDGVVLLKERIVQVKQSTDNLNRDAVEPPEADCTFKISAEATEKDKEGKDRPRYYHAGFTADVGGIVQMSDDDVENALDGDGDKDTFVITRPALRLIETVDPKSPGVVQSDNRDRVDAAALLIARPYVAFSSLATRILAARGFQRVECSGLVSEVRWSQDKLQTTATLNNWWARTGR